MTVYSSVVCRVNDKHGSPLAHWGPFYRHVDILATELPLSLLGPSFCEDIWLLVAENVKTM